VFGVEIAGSPAVWRERHLQLSLRQNGRTLMVKGWQFAERAGEFVPGMPVDVVLSFESDDYSMQRGYPGWSAILKDVRPAAV